MLKPFFKMNCRTECLKLQTSKCIVSKILERAVSMQLENSCMSQNLLYEYQSGFRGNYSTYSCRIHLTNHI